MTQKPLELLQASRPATRPVIALSEGSDPRIVAGAQAAIEAGIASVILVGDRAAVLAELSAQGLSETEFLTIHDPAESDLTAGFAAAFHDLRRHKGMDAAKARAAMENPLGYAAMLVRMGHAAGTVGGAVATTSDIVRTALQVIGKAPDAAMVSSFFLMYPPEDAGADARAMLYSDCGLVIDPDAAELAAIAAASARSCRSLMRDEPKIAMLSFSTKGSAKHPSIDKVTEAADRLQAAHPDLEVDGELQFDAAFVPAIGARKSPGSSVAGQANVMIFPNLDAGNIGYKMTQRLGGYTALGPILQGLAKPANDLSRGCSAEDVTGMIAVTVLQAEESSDKTLA
jgi:phosphate acetyltransferase